MILRWLSKAQYYYQKKSLFFIFDRWDDQQNSWLQASDSIEYHFDVQ